MPGGSSKLVAQRNTIKADLELEKNIGKFIWISVGERSIKVMNEHILYARSENTTTYFILLQEINNKKALISTTGIGRWEEILEQCGFCRIHNRYLVNLEHVCEYARHDSTIMVSNGDILNVSKQRKDHLLKRLGLSKFH